MNVQELIDLLEAIEDKTLNVMVTDWNEEYAPDTELLYVKVSPDGVVLDA